MTQYETTAVGFEGVDGHVSSVTTCHAQLFKPVPGTEEKHPVDLVLLAMGFTGAQKQFLDEFGVTEVNDDYTTNDEKVYVAGDARRGPSLVIWGIHEGRMAAEKSMRLAKRLPMPNKRHVRHKTLTLFGNPDLRGLVLIAFLLRKFWDVMQSEIKN